MIITNTATDVVEESNKATVGELTDGTLDASKKVLDVLNTMLDGIGDGSVSVADLKDITTMIKDVSMQIEKLSKSSGSSRSEGLASFYTRLKA